MKKIIYISILIFIPLFLNAQKSPVDRLLKKYKNRKEVTIKNVANDKIFDFNITDEQGNNLKSSINKIKVIKYNCSENDKTGHNDFYDKALKRIKKAKFNELLTVNKDGKQVNILIKKYNDRIKELNILVNKSDESILINIRGDIDFSQINKFKNFNIE